MPVIVRCPCIRSERSAPPRNLFNLFNGVVDASIENFFGCLAGLWFNGVRRSSCASDLFGRHGTAAAKSRFVFGAPADNDEPVKVTFRDHTVDTVAKNGNWMVQLRRWKPARMVFSPSKVRRKSLSSATLPSARFGFAADSRTWNGRSQPVPTQTTSVRTRTIRTFVCSRCNGSPWINRKPTVVASGILVHPSISRRSRRLPIHSAERFTRS